MFPVAFLFVLNIFILLLLIGVRRTNLYVLFYSLFLNQIFNEGVDLTHIFDFRRAFFVN